MHRLRQSISGCALATAAALALHSPAALAATYSFQTILYPGSTGTQANGINKSGVVVGAYSVIVEVSGEALTYFHSFKFENGQISTVEPPNSQQSEISGIADDGTIVGEYIENGDPNPHLVAFTLKDGVFNYFGKPGSNTNAGVSHAGVVFGTTEPFSRKSLQGYLYKDGAITFSDFGPARGVGGYVNDSGTVAGFATLPNSSQQGFVLHGANPHYFPGALADFTPFAINNSNVLAGNQASHGTILSQSQQTAVAYPGVAFTTLSGIDSAGNVVGSGFDGTHASVGFLFDGQSFTTIVPPTSGATTPTAINDVGQVIGVFFDNANPATQPSFLATPQ